jgi:hypothetical protein
MTSITDKLFTHEDTFNVHKIMGFYCIANYFTQIALYHYNVVWLTPYVMIPHLLLPITSFMFKVLSFRPTQNKMNMFIWNELRLHATIFTFRSCLAIIFPTHAIEILIMTLISADVATYYYGTPGISTVRGKIERHGKRNLVKELSAAFFSISQIGATIICGGLLQNNVSPILVFLTLPPIQTSAFGMTLLRKNIINKNTWTVVYLLELSLVYVYWYLEYGNVNIFLYALPFYLLRRQNVSKYILWGGYIAYHYYFICALPFA